MMDAIYFAPLDSTAPFCTTCTQRIIITLSRNTLSGTLLDTHVQSNGIQYNCTAIKSTFMMGSVLIQLYILALRLYLMMVLY